MNKSSLSMSTQKKLGKLFHFTGEQEQQLEFARQNLCKSTAFEPYASFQRLDRLSKGYLTPRDFINLLKDNGIDTADEFDAKLLIKYFDATGEGRLFYTDYLQILLPCDQQYLRAACTQRPTYPVPATEFLPFEVERLLAKLIQKELKLARESERIKQELASRYDYSLDRLFKDVDDINYGYVDSSNLKRFLIKCGIFPNEAIIISILRRFDLDADAKLNKKEFTEGVRPQADDFSKRTIKEQKSLATSRVFSPNKSSINHSSYKSHQRSQSRGANDSHIYDIKSPQSRGKSTQKNRKSALKKSQSKRLNDQSTLEYKTIQDRNEDNQLASILKSPSQNQLQQSYVAKDNSPLRMKSLASQNQFLSSQFDAKLSLHQNTLSPGQNRNDTSLSKSNKLGDSLYQTSHAASRTDLRSSQYRERNEKDEQDKEGSLIYLIRNCFKDFLAIESGLENAKKELALRSDFTLAGAFNLFTGYSQDRLSADDIHLAFERLGVVSDISDVRLFVERYDADRDGKLGFWEFANSLLPIETLTRDDLERRRAQFDLSYETKELLRRTFRRLIDAETMVENLRQRLSREVSVQLRAGFDALDWLGRGYLTNNEFKRAFENYGHRMSSSSLHSSIVLKQDSLELECFIRRFNKDKLNGRISLPEFLEELTPKNPSKAY